MSTHIIFKSEEDTRIFCKQFAKQLIKGIVVFFYGDLGAGKTFICKELIKTLSFGKYVGASPTFNIMQHYNLDNGMQLFHYDLYRLKHSSELYEIGLMEPQDGIVLVEWPQLAESVIKPDYIIKLTLLENGNRGCELISSS